MKQLSKILMMAVFATAFIACNDDDGVSFVGKDNYIVAFSLTVDGVTYDASITEGKIKVAYLIMYLSKMRKHRIR